MLPPERIPMRRRAPALQDGQEDALRYHRLLAHEQPLIRDHRNTEQGRTKWFTIRKALPAQIRRR